MCFWSLWHKFCGIRLPLALNIKCWLSFASIVRQAVVSAQIFSHVLLQFVGEVDQGVVKGLHNWIQLYVEEGKGNLKYLGYMNPRQCVGHPSS